MACRVRIERIRRKLPHDPVRLVQEAPAGLGAVERFLARVTPVVAALEP